MQGFVLVETVSFSIIPERQVGSRIILGVTCKLSLSSDFHDRIGEREATNVMVKVQTLSSVNDFADWRSHDVQ